MVHSPESRCSPMSIIPSPEPVGTRGSGILPCHRRFLLQQSHLSKAAEEQSDMLSLLSFKAFSFLFCFYLCLLGLGMNHREDAKSVILYTKEE